MIFHESHSELHQTKQKQVVKLCLKLGGNIKNSGSVVR